jgi:hypothetical protein
MEPVKKKVYIETTIPSYATARPSMDIISANRQGLTKLFWEYEREKYKLYISQFVLGECRQGDLEAAKRRLEFIKEGKIKCSIILKKTLWQKFIALERSLWKNMAA